MSDIEPQPVIELVERFVRREADTARQYDYPPFSEDTVWDLHALAREVYALGVKDGATQERQRDQGQRARERANARAEAVKPNA